MRNNDTIRQIIKLLQNLIDDEEDENDENFGEWLLEWYEIYKKPMLKKSSLRSTSDSINKLLKSPFVKQPLSRIDGAELQKYLLTIKAPNTRKKVGGIISMALEKAYKLQKITYNPYVSVELPSYRKKHYRPLEYDEQNKIIEYYENPHKYYNYMASAAFYRSLFWVLCCTGMRIGELLALDIANDVDRKKMIITVSKTMDRTGEISETPKTENSVRKIPILPPLLSHLDIINDFYKNGSIVTYNAVKQHFVKLYRRLEIQGANIHTFRHTFITLCYAAGMREKLIQRIAGHADISTTMNIYTHILDDGSSPLLDYVKKLTEATKLS